MSNKSLAAFVLSLPLIGSLLQAIKTSPEKEPADAAAKDKSKATSGSKISSADHLREGLEKIRSDLAAFGTAVGLAAGSITIATMFGTFDDLFPLPARFSWVILGIAAAFFAMAAVFSVLLTQRFFSARRRIVVETSVLNPWQPNDPRNADFNKREHERTFLEEPLRAYATGEGAANARALDLRRSRLERVAARAALSGNSDLASTANNEAGRLTQGIEIAFLSGALQLLEHRSIKVYRGFWTVALAAAVAIGAGGLFFTADWSRGERDRITAFNACVEDADDPIVCVGLDPREVPLPKPSLTPPAETAETPSPPSPQPDVLENLNTCAGVAPSPGVPDRLRESALALCAGLPVPSASAAPTG